MGKIMRNAEMIDTAEIEQDALDVAQANIKKGERVRLVYEILMETLGVTYENTFKEVIEAMKTSQEAYNQGVKTIETIIKQTHKVN